MGCRFNRGQVVPFLNLGHKAIAAARNSDDEPVRAGRFAKNASQRRDVLGQVVFLDDGIWPDGVHDAFRLQEGALVADQVKQGVENPRRERDLHVIPPQQPLFGVETEFAEFVEASGGSFHRV